MGMQHIAQIGMKLADALKYCHMRGYIHGAISSHCVYLVPNGGIKLGGWELATLKNVREFDFYRVLLVNSNILYILIPKYILLQYLIYTYT